MKRIFSYVALISLSAWALTACEPKNTPVEPEDPGTKPDTTVVPVEEDSVFSFPKKHLIEEFTGQGCGYCPYGMDCVHDFIKNDTNWILILHHDGYAVDNFTVSGSTTITKALNVDGAPSITINRSKTNYGSKKATVFHPGYLPNTKKSQFAETTYASIGIQNTYNPATRELNIHVSGKIGKHEAEQIQLTVLIKESGMVDYQSDYYETFAGWSEFRHANAVRLFLTASKGDAVTINGYDYEADFTATLKDTWVPENCMVVAFLSEAFKPVVQAEQRPVVEGTSGGADILHGGITRVPVDDFYPEPNATDGPNTYSGSKQTSMTYVEAGYQSYSANGVNLWTIMAYDATASVSVNNTNCVPFCYLYLFTELSQKTIPYGTYELNDSMEPGTAWAGYRDDENFEIGGCEFYYANKIYFNQGYLVPEAEWLIVDGTLTISSTNWTLSGHTRNGASVNLVGTTPISNSSAAMPAKRGLPKDQYPTESRLL